MKNLFKNINLFGVVAMLVVATATFAFSSRQEASNVYNAGTSTNENWQPLTRSQGTTSGTYRCLSASNSCTAHMDEEGNISDRVAGQYFVNP